MQTLRKFYVKLVEDFHGISMQGRGFASFQWSMSKLIETGITRDQLVREMMDMVSEKGAKNRIEKLFRHLVKQNIIYDNRFFKKMGITVDPINLSPTVERLMYHHMNRMTDDFSNLTKMTLDHRWGEFKEHVDIAYLQTATGVLSYDQALRLVRDKASFTDDIDDIVTYPSGHKDRYDVASRRAILTTFGQMAGQITLSNAAELGAGLVEVSAHIGARDKGDKPENHALWQGKIYDTTGSNPRYGNFYTETGYGTGAGLCGWNCRHSFYPFIEGVSDPSYTSQELDEIRNQTVKLNGEDIPIYDALQHQRYLERDIRRLKRDAIQKGNTGIPNEGERVAIKQRQADLRAFTGETGLPRNNEREQVENWKNLKKVDAPEGYVKKRKPKLQLGENMPDEVKYFAFNPSAREFRNKNIEDDYLTRYLNSMQGRRDEQYMGAAALDEHYHETVKKAISQTNEIWETHYPTRLERGDTLIEILQDDRIMTQFETGTSRGYLGEDTRADAEFQGFGYPVDDTPPAQRPVYGLAVNPTFGVSRGARQYGDIALVLKDDILDRTTISYDDSLGSMGTGQLQPSPARDVDLGTFGAWADMMDWGTVGGIPGYWELQFHGGVVPSRDVEMVIFDERYRNEIERKFGFGYDIIRLLEQLKIPWKIMALFP